MTLRPVKPQDVPLFLWASKKLSAGSRYFRFGKIAPLNYGAGDIEPLCNPDPKWETHFIVTHEESGRERYAGNARYTIDQDRQSCAFAIVVMDQWQHHGIGEILMNTLCQRATAQGIPLIYGLVLPTNVAMHKFMKKCGFQKTHNPNDDLVLRFERRLS